MIILIDGYNLLKSIYPDAHIDEGVRRTFLKALRIYAHCKKHTIKIVFDAGPYERIFKEKIDGITVVYSGRLDTADDCIMAYLDGNHTKDILVVSSDNEIARHASGLEIPSIGSHDFFKVMQDVLQQEPIVADHHVSVTLNDDTQDLDEIMREASQQVPIKQEDSAPSVMKKSAKKMSRAEKKLYAILKKL